MALTAAGASPRSPSPPAGRPPTRALTPEVARETARDQGLEQALRGAGWVGQLRAHGIRVATDPLRLERDTDDTPPEHADTPEHPVTPELLVAMRLGASERLLQQVLRHLGSRRVGDTTVLLSPLVRAQIAEAATGHLLVEAGLRELTDSSQPPALDAAARLHRDLTGIDRALLRLLGGRSFLTDGPGGTALVAECLPDLVHDAQGHR